MAREMKDSGVAWIGEIPSTWSIQRMKNCIASRQSGAWGDDATGETGDAICLRIADFDYARFRFKETPVEELTVRHYAQDVIERLKLAKGDILIEKSGGGEKTPVGRTVIFDKDYTALYANFMDCLRCTSAVYPQFMQYVFVTFYKNDYSRNYIKQTTGIQNLDLTAMLATEVVATPPIDEQICIATFLDRKCAEIDSVIADTQRTIEEYKKLKQSIITEAVTKGVRGKRTMKDSGIEWIGEVPTEWKILSLSQVTSSMRNGYVGPTKDLFVDEGVRYIQSLHVKDGAIIFSNGEYYVRPEWAQQHPKIHTDDILIVQTGDIGQVGLVLEEFDNCNCHALIIATPDKTVIKPKYLTYYLRSVVGKELLLFYKTGALLPHLNSGKIKFAAITCPLFDEQSEIITYLDNKCTEVDKLIAAKEQLLRELESYKKSVIYEHVTGKKEVPACR